MAGNTIVVPVSTRTLHGAIPSLPISVPHATRTLHGVGFSIPTSPIPIPKISIVRSMQTVVVNHFDPETVKVTVVVSPYPRTFLVTREKPNG